MAANSTRKKPSTPAQRTAPQLEIVPDLSMEVIDITPELAKEMLGRNVSNRRLTEGVVKAYARDMQAGRWTLNGEAIQFSEDGTLLNGQHRLSAIALSGVTVKMLVIHGLPKKAQETMDAGKKRTAVDNFTLRGETHAKTLAAIARKITLWERGDKQFREATTPVELAETLEKYPELLRRSAEVGDRVHKGFRPLPASVLGTAHFLLTRVGPEDVPWFFGAIESGAGLDRDDPVLTLRERVRRDREEGIRVDDVRAMGYLVRAWNASRKGKTLARIQHAKGEPIPEIL
jgi:hypothetical protein